MTLLVKGDGRGRDIVEVTPESAGWQHVGFRAWRLTQGEQASLSTGTRELCLVVLTGTVDVTVSDGKQQNFPGLGQRDSVFDDIPPAAVYVPPGHDVTLRATRDAEVALCTAPGRGYHDVRVLDPATMPRTVRGKGSNTRYVRDILPQTEPADHLLVVEVVTPAGHASSYPPHKHDRDAAPEETQLEETYYHRLNPPQGFAFQRVYTDDRSLDESMAVENHDVVMVPRGYHPCVAPHGYDLYYLNVMAGPGRTWIFKNDPAHEWMLR
ncbi:5-deoxy-glucuronate isomerase [Piscinibacter sp.]|uniref:5-deoxy-glucuronate isomerase n=1 Tax=Piscinibacter sp. TaxID=1903157 RepID=UPI002C634A1A|nr:5-deoxy-glucuronate isomerase [Albitalea sp.]HUG25290.1 5-deoxy-glucuronate isomerase [Albitalea sp.]